MPHRTSHEADTPSGSRATRHAGADTDDEIRGTSLTDSRPKTVVAARYAHTNLIARDWRSLVRFYTEVFGCEPVGPERDQTGTWLDQATGLEGAHLRGMHLRLPGHGDRGPTLEIFTYDETVDQHLPVANRAGYGHIAFDVPDVASATQSLIASGGKPLGAVAETAVPGVGHLQTTYARDPEGNIIELQTWRKPVVARAATRTSVP